MTWRWLLVSMVCITLACAARGQTVQDLKRRELDARGDVHRALMEFRRAEADESPAAAEARAAWVRAEAAYRRAVAARVIAESAGSSQPVDLAAQEQELRARQQRMRAAAAAHIGNRLASDDDADEAAVYADMEASLRTMRLEAEVLGEAARRQRPQIDAGAGDRRGRTRVSSTTQRMDELLHSIATKDTNETRSGRSAREHEIEMWMREREREMDLEEYQRLAQHGVVVSERTGRQITGVQRERLARDAEKQLSEAVAYHARDKKFLDLWSNTDSRKELAARLKERVDSAEEYKALEFLSPSEDSMPQYYRALALAAQRQQNEVDQWYTDTYLGQTEADSRRSALGQGVNAWWNTGFGTLARANDISGDTSDAHVRSRLDQMRGETDAAAEAFMAAARTPDPRLLPQRQRELLRNFGYIEEGPGNKLRYTIPSGRRQIGDIANANLPGASWLDALSMETVAVTAASVALPELAAARAAAWATKAGHTARTVKFASGAAGMGTSMGVDAGAQYLATGEVDPTKLLLDNLLIGTATGKASEAFGSAVTTGIGKLAKDTRLAKALRESGNGSALVRETEAMIRNAAGIGSEAVLSSYIQSVMAGNPGLTREDVLANLATGTLARTMAGSRKYGTDDRSGLGRDRGGMDFDKAVNRIVPPGTLRDMLTSRDLPLAMEERARTEHWTENNRAAWERFMRVTDNGKNVSEKALGEAVLKGEFSWADLKTVAADAPESLRPMHEAVARAREDFYSDVETRARARAKEGLEAEYQRKVAELEGRGLEAGELATQRESLERWRGEELGLINEPAVRLGSDAASSDIDRSWKSDRVRRAAKEVQDSMLYRRDEDRPGPTSAAAYDLNEYYDVMPFIKETFEGKMDLRQQPGATVGSMGAKLTHEQTMNAGSLAAAMLHMDPDQRARFERNRLEEAPRSERAALEAQFAWARENLAENAQMLGERARAIAEKTGRDPGDPDVQLTARDELYGERTRELHELERKIKALPDQKGPEAMRMRAEWEQKMTVALREGIETYSQTAGLDLICNTLQGEVKRGTDGQPLKGENGKPIKYKAHELLADPDFTINGRLKGKYTEAQLDGMLNDQVMFLSEHVNGYRHGHESAETAARAIGKYGERALLALHAKGDLANLPEGHPLRKFADITKQLVEHKDNPAELRRILSEMDASGDPDRGLRKLMSQLDEVPGMRGISSVEPSKDPASINLARQAARRRWEREREEARMFGGSEAEMALLETEEIAAAEETARLQDAQARQRELDSKYLRSDQREATRVEEELGSLKERLAHLPGGSENTTDTAKELREEIAKREGRLAELSGKYAAAGSPQDQGDETDALCGTRLAELALKKEELEAAKAEVGERMAAEEIERAQEAHERLIRGEDGSLADEVPEGVAAAVPEGGRPEDGLPPEPPVTERPRTMGAEPGPGQRCAGGGLEMRTAQLRYRIGKDIIVAYRTPEDPEWALPEIALVDQNGRQIRRAGLAQRGEGEVSLGAPTLAGRCEVRAVAEDGAVLCALPVEVVATPTPGALSISGGVTQLIGAPMTVSINVTEDVWHSSAWVGLYRLNHAGGDGSYRMHYWWIQNLQAQLELTVPVEPGEYELRLFDRDDQHYMLDALKFQVVMRAAPGSLSIPKHEFKYGEKVEVSIRIPEDVYISGGNAWVGLYSMAKESQRIGDEPLRLSYHWIHDRIASVSFTAPAGPDVCEVRLHDRNDRRLLLDSLTFTVGGQVAPGALEVEKPSYRIGEEVRVRVAIPEGVYFQPGNAWVGMYAAGDPPSDIRPTRGNIQYQWVHGREAELVFRAPTMPGEFEFELYDRNGDAVLLDRASFATQVELVPGALTPLAESANIGQSFRVKLSVPEAIHLDRWAVVSLHHVDGLVGSAGAVPAISRRYAHDVGREGEAEFTAPDYPGRFEVRLYDREHNGFLLASAPIVVRVPRVEGAIRIPKEQFAPGEEILATIELPPEVRLYSWSLVGVYAMPRPGFDGPPESMSRLMHAYVDLEKRTAQFRAPNWPGQYELRLMDRESSHNRLDRKGFEVVARTVAGALRAPDGADAGAVIEVSYRLPEGIYRQNDARIALVRPQSVAPGGAWMSHKQMASADLPGDPAGTVQLRMPGEPGTYELRLYDRGGEGLILDRRPLVVARPAR